MACSCFDLHNVFAGILSFALSILAVIMGIDAKFKADEFVRDTGSQLTLQTSALSGFVMLFVSCGLNGFSCLTLCLSTFDCVHTSKLECIHAITSSTSFCVLRICAFVMFVAQLIFNQTQAVSLGGAAIIAYICQMGSTTVFHAQEVIWEIGNFTLKGYDPYDPYRTGSVARAQSADTPYVQLSKIFQSLDLSASCPNSEVMWRTFMIFWLASLLSLASQVIMAIALNGEKERVNVHEQYAQSPILGVGGSPRDMQGLPTQLGGHIGEQMALLGQRVQGGFQNVQQGFTQQPAGRWGH